MIFWITFVIGILMFVVRYSKITETNHKKLLYIYLITWAVAMLLSNFGFSDLEIPSDFSYSLFIIHLVGFVIGTLLVKTTSSNKSLHNNLPLKIIENNILRVLNSSLFRTILVLMTIYVTYVFSKYWMRVLLYNNISETRYQLIEILGDFYYTFARPLLFLPTTIVCYVLFGYSLLKKRDWVCFLMGYYLVVNASLTGGRIGYVFIALGVVFVDLFIVKANLRKHWLKFSLAAVALYGVIVLITTFRSGSISMDSQNLEYGMEVANEQLVSYIVGPESAFDYALKNDYLSKIGGYGYGTFTITPLVNLTDLFTSVFGNVRVNSQNMKLITQLEDTPIYLAGGTHGWNALYTSVIFYYMDAGIVGVFIFPLIIGMLFSLLIKITLKRGSVIIFALCCYFFILTIKSIMKMEVFLGYDTFAITIMFIIGTIKLKKYGIKQY